jgi:aminoglycoside phosphotransferase (APT) family kinase protein
MAHAKQDREFEQLVHGIDPRGKLLRTWTLKAGAAAQVTALEILLADGQRKRMLVRRYGDADLERNPHVAQDEFNLLQLLQAVGLPTPMPYRLSRSGEILSTPYVVTEFIEGQTDFAPASLSHFIVQMAVTLTKIHSVDCSTPALSFLRRQVDVCADELENGPAGINGPLDVAIHHLLKSIWPLPQRNQSVLLHGDFWPGNLLWKDDRLVAVIDWEDAAVGDPLSDVANGRLEILWAFGIDAMNDFTRWYASTRADVDFADLPYWDLCAGLRLSSRIAGWGVDDTTDKRMREGYKWFANQALALLSGQ